MSGRVKQGRLQGGRGAHGGKGWGRGNSYPSHLNNLNNNNKGLDSALGNNVFDYGQKGAAYQTRITWENIINHVETIYGHDISNELQNKKPIDIPHPKYIQQVKGKHLKRVEELRYHHSMVMQSREFKLKLLEASFQR